MINATLRIPSTPRMLAKILRDLKSLLGPASVFPGCIDCRLYREVGEFPSLLLHQQWDSEWALENFLRSEDCRRLLGVMEAASAVPEIHFDTVSCTRGLELIEAARSPSIQVQHKSQ